MTDVADWWTPRIDKRAELARALKEKGASFLAGHALTAEDLDFIIEQGRLAKEADREQQLQIAAQKTTRLGRASTAAEVGEHEQLLAGALPAVIHVLARGTAEEKRAAELLAKLSFARYRMRVRDVPVKDAEGAEAATLERVERVKNSTLATRADGLAALCQTLRAPSQALILAKLAARGIDGAWLADLETAATAVAAAGRNTQAPAAATARERQATVEQRLKWSSIEKLVRRACKGDRALAQLLAEC